MKNVLFLPIVLAITITSCSPSLQLVETSCTGYKSNDFARDDILNKGIGIMPVLGGDEKEQFRRPMGDAVYRHMRSQFGAKNVKSPTEVISIINDNSLSDAYSNAINNYASTGIVPKEMVTKLGASLNTDYLLYSRLLAEREYAYDYITKDMNKVDEIYLQTQVWDTHKGDVVWEGKGGVTKLISDSTDVVEKTAEGLVKIIGTYNKEPCKDRKALLNSIQQSHTSTWVGLCFIIIIIYALKGI